MGPEFKTRSFQYHYALSFLGFADSMTVFSAYNNGSQPGFEDTRVPGGSKEVGVGEEETSWVFTYFQELNNSHIFLMRPQKQFPN